MQYQLRQSVPGGKYGTLTTLGVYSREAAAIAAAKALPTKGFVFASRSGIWALSKLAFESDAPFAAEVPHAAS